MLCYSSRAVCPTCLALPIQDLDSDRVLKIKRASSSSPKFKFSGSPCYRLPSSLPLYQPYRDKGQKNQLYPQLVYISALDVLCVKKIIKHLDAASNHWTSFCYSLADCGYNKTFIREVSLLLMLVKIKRDTSIQDHKGQVTIRYPVSLSPSSLSSFLLQIPCSATAILNGNCTLWQLWWKNMHVCFTLATDRH